MDNGIAQKMAEAILASPMIGPSGGSVTLADNSFPPLNKDRSLSGNALAVDFDKLSISNMGSVDDEADDPRPGQCNLFVGDLARTVNEEAVRKVFEQCGEVVNVDIKRDKVTNNNLGYGFVQFATREQAVRAKRELEGVEIGGRKIRVGWAQKNTTLFVGDLDGTVTSDTLREVFSEFGPLVREETFVKSGGGKFGFVRFQHRADAERAKAELNRKVVPRLGSRPIRIGWGDNSIQKHCVHIQFNPQPVPGGGTLTEPMLRQHFEDFGRIVSISLPRYQNRRLKGFGFVHYTDNDEGERAAGKAIATHADTKIGNINIRSSYGKRQMFNNRHRSRASEQLDEYGDNMEFPHSFNGRNNNNYVNNYGNNYGNYGNYGDDVFRNRNSIPRQQSMPQTWNSDRYSNGWVMAMPPSAMYTLNTHYNQQSPSMSPLRDVLPSPNFYARQANAAIASPSSDPLYVSSPQLGFYAQQYYTGSPDRVAFSPLNVASSPPFSPQLRLGSPALPAMSLDQAYNAHFYTSSPLSPPFPDQRMQYPPPLHLHQLEQQQFRQETPTPS